MGDVIDLKSPPANLADNIEFVSDCCRYRESILDEKAVKKKWKFDDATWEQLGDDDELIRKVEEELIRRIRTGQQKRGSVRRSW